MGLFLQKTNILRDYLEDYVDGRAFWPASVWKTYAKNDDLGYFRNDIDAGVMCLNEVRSDEERKTTNLGSWRVMLAA